MTSSNSQLQIYQNTFPKHTQGDSTSNANSMSNNNNNQNNSTNNISYKNVPSNYDGIVMCISQVEPRVSMIRAKGKDSQCVVTTHRTHIFIPGPSTSSQPTPMSSQYNILDHLGKTLAQIFILDLLKSSPVHQEILTKPFKILMCLMI